ncbi:MAG: hypothetical protein JSU86_16260 [Phycisphaerales bacterium]|nr:MAG: hypothetical protein JSU86_16260 [Phycisphaerales bacterium]
MNRKYVNLFLLSAAAGGVSGWFSACLVSGVFDYRHLPRDWLLWEIWAGIVLAVLYSPIGILLLRRKDFSPVAALVLMYTPLLTATLKLFCRYECTFRPLPFPIVAFEVFEALLALPIAYVLACVVIACLEPNEPSPAGYCRKCGYDLTGNVSGVCPECGTEIEKP